VNFVRNQALDTTIIDESADSWRSAEVTVDIILDSMKVRARVQRDGVGLWFARVLGADFATVRAVAAAVAAEAGASSCMVPFAIPIDPSTTMTLGQLMVLKTADSSTVAGVDPFFAPFAMEPDPNVPNYCPRARGDDADQAWGGSNVCSTCAPSTGRFPGEAQGGWHQATPVDEWLAGEQNPGGSYYPGDGYTENICGNNCSQINAGEQRTIVTGDMDGPTAWGVNARLALDPDVTWNENDNQVYRGNTPLDDYGSTPRVVKVPTFDRNELTHSSDRTFTINGFSYFFLERGPDAGFYNPTDQLEIIGRFLYHAPGDAGGGSIYSRVLRLVE
jgi:hypothetical protein